MPVFRPGRARGRLQHAGGVAVHSFSAGDFVDRDWTGFGALRVLAEETLAPGAAPPAQRRANMQILTWVRCGVLAWSDGAGDGGELHGGVAQLLDAGHGADQIERNPSAGHPVDLVRLWIQPSALNTPPRRFQARFEDGPRHGRWQTLAAPGGAEGGLPLRARARVRSARVAAGSALDVRVAPGQRLWLHVLHGRGRHGPQALGPGDAIGWRDEPGAYLLEADEAPLDLLSIELPPAA